MQALAESLFIQTGTGSDPEKEYGKPDKSGCGKEQETINYMENRTSQNEHTENGSQARKERKNVGLWIGASLCFLVLVGGIVFWMQSRAPESEKTRTITFTDIGFDTPITFKAQASEADFEKYAAIVKDTFSEYNEYFDQYHTYEGVNNVATLNEKAATEGVKVSQPLKDCLELAIKAYEQAPSFDIAEGRVLSLWHDAREASDPYVPDKELIEKAMDSHGADAIQVKDDVVTFVDSGVQVDLGGIAKGYTAGITAQKLREAGLTNGFINAGGNVVLVGPKADGSDWVVGIENPETGTSLLQYTTSTPTSIVTSGDYQRYMEVDGKRYGHIIDPKTGYPATYMRSVTVINEDSGWADAMSTALFCLPVDEGRQFADAHQLSAVWITEKDTKVDGAPDLSTDTFNVYCTPDLKDQIRLSQ